MAEEKITLSLEPAEDDLPIDDPVRQAELKEAGRVLKEESGASVAELMLMRKAVGAPSGHFGQYVMTVAPPVATAIASVAGAWLHAHLGRKVRIKIGDVEAEASTPKEVEQLLEKAKSFKGLHDDDSSV